MGDEAERYNRIVRAPSDDPFIISPPEVLLNEAERLGQDPRRPRTSIARWVSSVWAETRRESIRRGVDAPEALDSRPSEKELMERPAHFPSDFGLGLIPFPDDVGGWVLDKLETTCYTSLSAPRPFDPHLHGDTTPSSVGYGYHYHGKSPFPDRYDIVNRRGGGPRGGFAYTTGPTDGNYPSTIMPSPTFNLGELGFSDGGWNPEGLQYTNRPKKMKLSGLRNGWPHKAFFVRSRQVFFRNVYGAMSVDEATPRAPTVVINGSKNIHGITKISMRHQLNGPREMRINISSIAGRRAGLAKVGDTIQIYASPRFWANPPLVFTGFISDISETGKGVSIIALDSLGFLTNETILTETLTTQGDAASVIKGIIAGSSYGPPIGKISTQSLVTIPEGLKLKGRTRLEAVQNVLNIINHTPTPMTLYADYMGYIHLIKLKEINDVNMTPLVAGRLPRSDVPLDFYPTTVERSSGDLDFFNVVTIINDSHGVEETHPSPTSSSYPSRPVHKLVREKTVIDSSQAISFAKLLLSNQGRTKERYVVEGLPERFDILAGDVMDFATSSGLAGLHRVYGVSWELGPDGAFMTLNVGRQSPDLIATIRSANDLSI